MGLDRFAARASLNGGVWMGMGILALWLTPGVATAGGVSTRLAETLGDLPAERIETGILHDRVLSLSGAGIRDGTAGAPAMSPASWLQIYDEMRRASLRDPGWPAPPDLRREVESEVRSGVVPIAILNVSCDRIREDALETGALVVRDGRLSMGAGEPFVTERWVAAVPLQGHTYRGGDVRFRFDSRRYFSNGTAALRSVAADFDDARGFVRLEPGVERRVRYEAAGEKTIRVRAELEDGSVFRASGLFDVRGLRAPSPHDTLHIVASIPYGGVHGAGEAFVYLAEGHTTITEPIVVIEGFDMTNSMNWDELYDLLNREQMLETLRAEGFDAVVLNFDNAVDYIQRNSYVAVELIQQVRAAIGPGRTMALVGASMGGLIGRYALDYMEANGLSHDVRTFISFDSPQKGASIPLGIQYWLAFFADESVEAAALLAALDSPGARQMLAYHHTDPPGGTGQPDPLRSQLLAELAALGDYPELPRTVAIANGSARQWSQGFMAGAQIIQWEYGSFLVDIIGNVWAVPDGGSHEIFHGMIDTILDPPDEQSVVVAGTMPYDNAPGGWRASMAEMDAVDAPFGDIVALHPNHDFIPTVSALALDAGELFYDIAGDPDILAHTPFDAVYFPGTIPNQEHVEITAENAAWFLAEVRQGANAVEDDLEIANRTVADIEAIGANPTEGIARLRLTVPRSGRAEVAVYDVTGRRLMVVADREYARGAHVIDLAPRIERPGVYFVRLSGRGYVASCKTTVR